MKQIPDDAHPEISYPTMWKYTVIGSGREKLEAAIAEVVEERSHKVSLSNVSSKGRYCSLTLELIVQSDDERKMIFNRLRDNPVVKYVL
jgi:putative lipoic acid-binding regulatory protein